MMLFSDSMDTDLAGDEERDEGREDGREMKWWVPEPADVTRGEVVVPETDSVVEPPFLINGGLVMIGGGSGLNRKVTSLQSSVHRRASWMKAAMR